MCVSIFEKKRIEMELKELLESGLDCFGDYNSLSKEDRDKIWKQIDELISAEALEKEPLMKLALDFFMETIYHKRIDSLLEFGDMQGIAYLESEGKYLEVQEFLRELINTLNKAPGIIYLQQRKMYYENKEVLASILDFNIDPDQFWYLLQFCKYYVFSHTKNLNKTYQSTRDDLKMLVDELSKMEFENADWSISYPRRSGKLTIKVDCNNQHHITNYRTLHLLSAIIQDYLDRKHDYNTSVKLDMHTIQESKDFVKYMYCRGNKEKLTDEEVIFYETYNPWNDDSKDTKYDTDAAMRRVALFTYYIEQFLKDKKGQKEYVHEYFSDYNPGVGISHNKLFLISRLIYIMGDIHDIPKEKRHKLLDNDNPNYLKDCLRGYRIKDQKGVDECLELIRQEGIQK